MQFRAVRAFHPADIMAGGQRLGAQLARGVQQVGELDLLIAAHAGDRGFAAHIAVGEILDHLLAEAAFVIQHIVGNADLRGDALGVIDVRAGAAGAFARRRLVFRIKLQGDADHVIALLLSSAAVTEESTPPDMAATMRLPGLRAVSILAGPIGPDRGTARIKLADQPVVVGAGR